MIFSYISGRLGNQLFEYAYIRSLIYKRGRSQVQHRTAIPSAGLA